MADKHTMKDVSHTAPFGNGEAATVFHRGGERVPEEEEEE